MVNVAIVGFGVVGSGTADLLTENAEVIRRATGQDVSLKYVVDIREFPQSPYRDRIIHDFSVVEKDPEVSVVIETIGGVRAAYDFTRRALSAGKSVVSSNKELVATHGVELLRLAEENGCFYLFEAAVGGGIPVLKPLVTELSHNRIREVSGILNGTTNYILTRMVKGGVDFDVALKEAQANGYAEADPTADVMGHDACRKIAILAALATGKLVSTDKIPTEGITGIRLADVRAAASVGASIKLLGRAVWSAEGWHVLVAPFLIGENSPLSTVDDVYNGVCATGDFVGDVMFYGRGAGSYPTASAVVSDVCALLRGNAPRFAFSPAEEADLAPADSFLAGRYLAVAGVDISAARVVLGEVRFLESEGDELCLITEEMTDRVFEEKCRRLEACGAEIRSAIRIF